jgi:putative spermidine/putrescine transport system substrate-binding protein
VWAQDTKDIVLNHTGMSYSALDQIAQKASQDLPFRVEMAVVGYTAVINRMVTRPHLIDIADYEIWQRLLTVPRNVVQPIDLTKISHWDKVLPLFTEGTFGGTPVSRQGVSPFEVMFFAEEEARSLAESATDWATMVPTVFNADTLGIQPEAIGRPVEHWHELLNEEFTHRAALQASPAIAVMDAAMALESRGDLTYGDKGNMTRDEIDHTIGVLTALKRKRHWRGLWSNFEESVELMLRNDVVIQSMWAPAVAAVRSKGMPCYYVPLKEGYRGWGNGLSVMHHLDGKKLGAAYDYLNWFYDGWVGAVMARQGYYMAVQETARPFLTANEWDYWYGGKPATEPITNPAGEAVERPGHVRDGGSFEQRFGNIACWNTLMDEAQYMLKSWTEFIAA